ncbi:hypothetical protein ACFVVL_33930 [Kitasatospora sp. NPDC058115]|uniref:hypothetical protein n=1 Tax=Kitasatospora sp. NPDC058115 TaxID=3346347 RepID=UPI0036DA3E8E
MSVSIYYSARRANPLTEAETASVEHVLAAHAAEFPFSDEEGVTPYDYDEDEPEELVSGATKLPSDPSRLLPALTEVLNALSALRRALPGTEWHVHMDDLDVPWSEDEGYAFPGMRDGELDVW